MDFSNKSSVKEIKERFDKDVERFSNLQTGQREAMDAALMMDLITASAVAVTPNPRALLDIGCGAGNNTLKMLQQVNPMECDLVDLSAPMLKRAQQRVAAATKGGVRVYHGDFRGMDLPAGHYDVIIAAAVLHHLRDDNDWRATFKKIFALTAPGGSVWITDFVSHGHAQIQELMWRRYGEYLQSFSNADYQQKIFSVIEKEDTPRPVHTQLEMLKEVGFASVEILHKNSVFAAFGATKSKE